MGNNESIQSHSNDNELDNDLYQSDRNKFYQKRYNLIPSFKNNTYEIIDKNFNKFNTDNELPDFVDLRKSFVDIINIESLPFNPIACVSYLLEYSMLKNGLSVFPPSLLFIYKHCKFYHDTNDLISFETIFKAIRSKGFCIETEFRTNKYNLINKEVTEDLLEKAQPYKFMKVYHVINNISIIKRVLYNKYPILVGFSLYYKLTKVGNSMWIPNENIEQNIGGIGGVLVGYIEEREVFIMDQTYGNNFGQNGYILIPYKYITNNKYTFEMYVLDLDKNRIEGYLSQIQPLTADTEHDDDTESIGFLSNLFR